ncbi:MAG TPA: thioredoxin family protein [Solirubrobacterales bacterium]
MSAPDFELPDTEGVRHSLSGSDAAATVVYWTCNHCPYALAWEDRMHAVSRDYAERGVRTLAINSNDAERYPGDSLPAMAERVAEEDWPHPFLHDESQEVARAWGAERTPHVFVLDADLNLRYEGAPDGDYENESGDAEWVRAALDAVLAGDQVARPNTEAVGCTIKWR